MSISNGFWIQTFTGVAFDLDLPDPHKVTIKDIAQSLANQCRFAGHSKRFYSVAEHCLFLSRAVRPELAMVALLHDATEAYCQDMVRPIKAQFPDFKAMEQRIWEAIAARFRLPGQLPEEVREADLRMLATEAEYLMTHPSRPWALHATAFNLEDIGLNHPSQFGLPPREAHRRFLERFAELAA